MMSVLMVDQFAELDEFVTYNVTAALPFYYSVSDAHTSVEPAFRFQLSTASSNFLSIIPSRIFPIISRRNIRRYDMGSLKSFELFWQKNQALLLPFFREQYMSLCMS